MKKLNFISIIQNLLPPNKRQAIITAYLKVLAAPLQALNDFLFTSYYPDVTRRTRWNAQVLLFAKLLNDLHNPGNYADRIYINGGIADVEQPYFYNPNEEIPVYFFNAAEEDPLYLFNEPEYEPEFDFVVYYPEVVAAQKDQIDSTVKKYKIAGTNYQLVEY